MRWKYIEMCCSTRAAVFFLASNHIFFSITQMAYILPIAMGGIGDKVVETLLGFTFAILFFTTGFMTFRAADEESATLVRLGGICLSIVIVFRFILIAFSLMLVETIPEASFLYVYETPLIPIIFTLILYFVYLAILFCYYKELKHESSVRNSMNNGAPALSSPAFNFPIQRHSYYIRQEQQRQQQHGFK